MQYNWWLFLSGSPVRQNGRQRHTRPHMANVTFSDASNMKLYQLKACVLPNVDSRLAPKSSSSKYNVEIHLSVNLNVDFGNYDCMYHHRF